MFLCFSAAWSVGWIPLLSRKRILVRSKVHFTKNGYRKFSMFAPGSPANIRLEKWPRVRRLTSPSSSRLRSGTTVFSKGSGNCVGRNLNSRSELVFQKSHFTFLTGKPRHNKLLRPHCSGRYPSGFRWRGSPLVRCRRQPYNHPRDFSSPISIDSPSFPRSP